MTSLATPVAALLALVGVLAPCDAPACGRPTSAPISVDGAFEDWAGVFANPLNVTRDGDGHSLACSFSTDRDCLVDRNDRDTARFAWSWDNTNFYLFAERFGSQGAKAHWLVYVDADNDGLVEAGEPAIYLEIQNEGAQVTLERRSYQPAAGAGDPLVDGAGLADGYDMPGNANAAISLPLVASAPGGFAVEAAVPWAQLGVPAGAALGFHVGSGSAAGLPNTTRDNLGAEGGGPGTTAFRDLSLSGGQLLTGAPNAPLLIRHRVCNTGNLAARIDIRAITSEGHDIRIEADDNGDTVPDRLLGLDDGGDASFVRSRDLLTPAGDGDANGVLDTGVLAPGACLDVCFTVDYDDHAKENVQYLSATADDAADNCPARPALDEIHVGKISIFTAESRSAGAGAVVWIAHQLANNTDRSERIDLSAVSPLGWPYSFVLDPNGDGDPSDAVPILDTDGSGRPDVGVSAGGLVPILLRASIPPAAVPGQVDAVKLEARVGGGKRGETIDRLTVSDPIDIVPDHLAVDGEARFGGAGQVAWFPHVVVNAQPDADTLLLSAVSDLGWTTDFMSDPDCDGQPFDSEPLAGATGLLAGSGGSTCVLLRVHLPTGATTGTASRTTVSATSAADPGVTASAADDAVVALVRTYANAAHVVSVTTLAPCSSVHAAASGLPSSDPALRFIWRDTSGTAVRVFPAASSATGEAADVFALGPGDGGPGWTVTVERFDGAAWVVLDVATFQVVDDAWVPSLTAGAPHVHVLDTTLTASAVIENSSLTRPSASIDLRWVVLNPAADRYLQPDGTFAPYTGLEATRAEVLPPLAAGASLARLLSVAAVDFEELGTHSIELHQSASCGGAILAGRVTFEVLDDADDDGLDLADELAIGSDPFDADSDDDGLLDGEDGRNDSDGDTLPDALDCDSDDDGLFDGLESGRWSPHADTDVSAGCFRPDIWPGNTTNPDRADTDGGGVSDGIEDRDGDGKQDAGETDPNDPADDLTADSDGDGLTDLDELTRGTSPLDADSDDDGRIDSEEPDADSDGDTLPDALDCDSDGDGLPDGLEVGLTLPDADTDFAADCFRPDSDPGTTTDPALADSDAGGVPDGVEDADGDGRVSPGEGDPSNSADDDSDGDGLPNLEEDARGTSRFDRDSDDDGRLDSEEPDADSDGDTLPDALDCDSDGDGLRDGLEVGLTLPDADTDLAAGCFLPDSDPSTTTDPVLADSDSGGVPDGVEDADGDGRVGPGEGDPTNSADDDSDGDGLANLEEDARGTSRFDRDSDDDGRLDSEEPDADSDGDTLPDALDCDSDGDGLPDGLEVGLTLPDAGTDLSSGCFQPDADPSTTTDPALADSDGGGVADGIEDENRDGRVDASERDPGAGGDDACSTSRPPEVGGLRVSRQAGDVQLDWTGVADPCATYVVHAGAAASSLSPLAAGVPVPAHLDGGAVGLQLRFYVVSATSRFGGEGPTGR